MLTSKMMRCHLMAPRGGNLSLVLPAALRQSAPRVCMARPAQRLQAIHPSVND